MACIKNEQQQNARNDAELHNKWMKTTCRTFVETIRRGRNRSIKVYLVTDDDDDNDYYYYYYYYYYYCCCCCCDIE